MKPRCPVCSSRLPAFPSPWTTPTQPAVETCSEKCCLTETTSSRAKADAALNTQMNAERAVRNAIRRAS